MKQPRFYLLGDSSAKNPSAISRAQIELWEREGIIEYLGVCDDVRGIIEACDCVVLPSYKEGAPRILLEAMALHKPIITTNAVGCKDCVKAPLKSHNGVLLGENGILCEARSATSLQNAMLEFMRMDSQTRIRLGKRGREFAIEKHDIRSVVGVYRGAVKKLRLL